jgi:hypothetical protein
MEAQWELLKDVLREPNLRELILEHFEESGVDHNECPLDVDFDMLLQLETKGILKLITGRVDGCLAGYMIWYLNLPLDFKTTLHAIQGPWNMGALLEKSIPGLREMGVKRIVAHLKTHVRKGSLVAFYERLGFRETERVYYKVISLGGR